MPRTLSTISAQAILRATVLNTADGAVLTASAALSSCQVTVGPTEDGGVSAEVDPATVVAEVPRVGRNDPCPCGSGRKYKQCHGKLS